MDVNVVIGGTPTNAPFLNIQGEPRPRKLKGSGFTIVINTNKRPQGNTAEEMLRDEAFKRADLFGAYDVLRKNAKLRARIFKFVPEKPPKKRPPNWQPIPYQGDKWNSTFIKRAVFDQPTTEVGLTKIGGRVHLNASIRITHYSNIHIDKVELQKLMLGLMFAHNEPPYDLKSLHINFRAFNLNKVTLARYASKELGTERGRQVQSLVERLLAERKKFVLEEEES